MEAFPPIHLGCCRFVCEAAPNEHPLSGSRSEEHTSELQSQSNLVCRLLLEKKKIFTKSFADKGHHRGHSFCRIAKVTPTTILDVTAMYDCLVQFFCKPDTSAGAARMYRSQ